MSRFLFDSLGPFRREGGNGSRMAPHVSPSAQEAVAPHPLGTKIVTRRQAKRLLQSAPYTFFLQNVQYDAEAATEAVERRFTDFYNVMIRKKKFTFLFPWLTTSSQGSGSHSAIYFIPPIPHSIHLALHPTCIQFVHLQENHQNESQVGIKS